MYYINTYICRCKAYIKYNLMNTNVNTLQKFLTLTGYKRHTNHPTPATLKAKTKVLNISKDLKIDIYSYFLYDSNSK